jgi:GntP family gluconate:H+ symporter
VLYGHWINRRIDDIPLRESMRSSAAKMEEMAERPTERLPGMVEATLPITLAVVLIASNTTVDSLVDAEFVAEESVLVSITSFLGDANFALTAAALAAALTFFRIRAIDRETWADELVESLRSGGHIAAITAAGGAFGATLAEAGIGDYIATAFQDLGIPLLVAGWVIAATIRIAQGSATVAMLTTAGIMAPLVPELAVHPVYLALIIGAGGNICSWFNDSGFWVIKEIGGLTQTETLQIWTVLTTIISVSGFLIVMLMSTVVPDPSVITGLIFDYLVG